jgi:hypothetical protein
MKKAGNRCELVPYESAGHGFFNWGRGLNKNFADTLGRTHRFLVSLGWTKGEPAVADFFKEASQ